MSQLVACQWPGGLVIAADRRVETHRGQERAVHTVRKLFPLGPQAAVATSGAAVGIWVSRVLSRLLRRRAVLPLHEVESYALSVFQKEYDQFVHQGREWFAAHPDAHRRSYVLLGGKRGDRDFTFRFHASEDHGQPYRALGASRVLTAPRRLGLEGRLAQASADEAPDEDDLLGLVVAGLRQVAAQDPAVGAPFDAVVLSSRGGVRWQVYDEPPPPPRLSLVTARD